MSAEDDAPTESLDFSTLEVTDVPIPTETFTTPDYKASQEPKIGRGFGRRNRRADNEPTPRTRTVKAKKPAPRAKKGAFVQPLAQMYAYAGVGLMPFDPVCGQAVLQSAQQCAEALDDLAYQNEAVRRVLTGLVTTSAMGAVIMAHAPILIAVAMHHVPAMKGGRFNAGLLGALNPESAPTTEEAAA